MLINKAIPADHKILTEISFQSKGHWNYLSNYFDIWKDELTITKEYITKNLVFVVENNGTKVGYYSVVNLHHDIEVSGVKIEKGYWLEHMFILPQFLRQKIGTKMVTHLKKVCAQKGISQLCVLADPNSKGFYEKMGFDHQKKECPSAN